MLHQSMSSLHKFSWNSIQQIPNQSFHVIHRVYKAMFTIFYRCKAVQHEVEKSQNSQTGGVFMWQSLPLNEQKY